MHAAHISTVGGGLKATAEAGVPGATAGSSLSKFMIELIVEAHHHAVYSSCGLDKLNHSAGLLRNMIAGG